ncbi:FitA-like ribbon-helix-helix domain-containing protein [Kribbia dieselivorans]|uniref:FitA-like ribbon-helix-helix domain-containing protein n=1 Tax=Kribbia dieselivorans TaxID=331526 RepID=UPI00083881CB|nr:antitoxin [Kribbia dieselivorans]
MPTLYVRDVPPDVVETLKERASATGMSLSAYVVGELRRIAERPTNEEIVARLQDLDRRNGPSTDEILAALSDSRP